MDWFRVYVDMPYDRKLRRLPAEQRWLWIAVLSVARQSNADGALYVTHGVPATTEDLADVAAISLAHTEHGLARFVDQGMLHQMAGVYIVTHWKQRQYEYESWSREARRKQKQTERLSKTDAPTCDNADVSQASRKNVANVSQASRKENASDSRAGVRAEYRYTEKAAATGAGAGAREEPIEPPPAASDEERFTEAEVAAAMEHIRRGAETKSLHRQALQEGGKRLDGLIRCVILRDIRSNAGVPIAPAALPDHGTPQIIPGRAATERLIEERKARIADVQARKARGDG